MQIYLNHRTGWFLLNCLLIWSDHPIWLRLNRGKDSNLIGPDWPDERSRVSPTLPFDSSTGNSRLKAHCSAIFMQMRRVFIPFDSSLNALSKVIKSKSFRVNVCPSMAFESAKMVKGSDCFVARFVNLRPNSLCYRHELTKWNVERFKGYRLI